MPRWFTCQLSLFDLFRDRKKRQAKGAAPTSPKKPRKSRAKRGASDPQLKELWNEISREYFPERPDLADYQVYWSNRRQIRTLASCNIDSKKVRVARELSGEQQAKWLHPLLYHEMCHAVLGDSIRRKGAKTAWHGPEFRALERRHPGIPELDHWIKVGGWASAVRSHRAKEAHQKRKASQKRA